MITSVGSGTAGTGVGPLHAARNAAPPRYHETHRCYGRVRGNRRGPPPRHWIGTQRSSGVSMNINTSPRDRRLTIVAVDA